MSKNFNWLDIEFLIAEGNIGRVTLVLLKQVCVQAFYSATNGSAETVFQHDISDSSPRIGQGKEQIMKQHRGYVVDLDVGKVSDLIGNDGDGFHIWLADRYAFIKEMSANFPDTSPAMQLFNPDKENPFEYPTKS